MVGGRDGALSDLAAHDDIDGPWCVNRRKRPDLARGHYVDPLRSDAAEMHLRDPSETGTGDHDPGARWEARCVVHAGNSGRHGDKKMPWHIWRARAPHSFQR